MMQTRPCDFSVWVLSKNYSYCTYLQSNQTLYLTGGLDGDITDTVWYVQGDSQPQPEPEYTCNAEEADSRVWLHIERPACKHILLVSPDTDVYYIGLGLDMGTTHVLIQVHVSLIHCREIHYIDMRALTLALANDPDLAGIPSCILPRVFQTLFVYSGCDYTFFSQLGKATTVLQYFLHYPAFISGEELLGTLADISLVEDKNKDGYFAFLSLIGTVHFPIEYISPIVEQSFAR